MNILTTLSTLLIVSPALLASVGVGLVAQAGLDGAFDLVTSLRRRWGKRVLLTVHAHEGATLSIGHQRLALSWPLLLPTVGGIILAILWHHPMLSTWTALLGGIGTVLGYYSQPRKTAEDRALQEVFLSALRSRYGITQSLRRTLEGVAEDLDAAATALGQALNETLRLLQAGEPVQAAVKPLAEQGRVLRRLTTVLIHSARTAPRETQQLLAELEDQARQSRRRAERAHITLTVTRGTLRVLVVSNTTAAFLVALLPLWRAHYLAHPWTYMAATSLAFVGVLYFRFRIKHLEESL